MYEGKTVSVAIATYREKKTIKSVLDNFYKTNFVDEIIVIDNNAEKGTYKEITKSTPFKKGIVKIYYEKKQGYGYAYKTAIKKASCDYIVICEADGSLKASDIEKFLVYSRDFDVVLGTRTSQIGSLSGTGMGIIRKFANVLEAKTIEILFNSVALTDVGCTYKLFKKEALKKNISKWSNNGTALFNTELTLHVVTQNLKFVEIPISYTKSTRKSAIVGRWWQTINWAIVIQIYIFYFFIKQKFNF
ncbi:MAG TPA: glycosyltransferase family 2 protein [Patescibacteria group bacterium]|nr:glycosyltransferase family 2 protein [Patescibacteria group bacterium]